MANFWQLLKGALQSEPLRIGTIVASNSNKTVTCAMADGGSLTVRGTGSIGDVVFIAGGEVRTAVSGLTTFAAVDV